MSMHASCQSCQPASLLLLLLLLLLVNKFWCF
jgi:hypothetical protein